MVHQLHAQAERLRDRPALWSKRSGTWQPTSWRQYAQRVKDFALGLLSLGFGSGQALVVLGFNREEWVVADLAAMACGGTAVGVYTTSSPEQLAYVARHSEASIALVENEAYLERLLSVRGELPTLKHLLVMDPPARRREGVSTYAELLEKGTRGDDAEYYARLGALEPEGLAQLIYTSGTTGHPKGVMLTHRNLAWTAVHLSLCHPTSEEDVLLSYLPLSHIAEQICTLYGPLLNGIQVYFSESFEKLPQNLREVRPTVFFGVPRVWEKFMAKVEAVLRRQPRSRQKVVAWAREQASRYHAEVLSHRQPPLGLQAQYALAQRLVFQKLKEQIGFERTHLFATSAAPIAREVLEFFASLDVVIAEAYGQSEVTGPTSVNARGALKLGSLGRPMPGVEVRIADDGEILVRGENVCRGYFKDEASTAELLRDGWLHSGDVGQLDEDGFLHITGRKKELIVTSGGKKTAPAHIEGLLKALEPIGNALVIGDGRSYLTAILTVDPEKVESFAQAQGLPADAEALVAHPAFHEHLTHRIEAEVNSRLARFETIKKFEVLPHDFTVEGGELTSTLKVRRKVCEAKYAPVIERLYA
jgi:long-chain acyl-CoA synthetase